MLFESNPTFAAVDLILGILYLTFSIFALPNNLSAFIFFGKHCLRRANNITVYLYCLTALNDCIASVLFLYSSYMAKERSPGIMTICKLHRVLFRITERTAIVLMAALSISKTYCLIYPLRVAKPKIVLLFLTLLWVVIVLAYSLTPIMCGKIEFIWQESNCISVYPHDIFDILSVVGLVVKALPILPILVSSCISLHIIRSSHKVKFGSLKLTRQARRRLRSTSNQTTWTILLTTALYLILRVPILIIHLLYVLTVSTYPSPFFSTPFMRYYSWNVFITLFSAINTCANPLIYLSRFQRYRRWVLGCYRESPEETTASVGGRPRRAFQNSETGQRCNIVRVNRRTERTRL